MFSLLPMMILSVVSKIMKNNAVAEEGQNWSLGQR